jgi:membrane-bound ClpP family serine protease
MANWNEIANEMNDALTQAQNTYDNIRRKYLKELNNLTKRNVIIYYSGWLQKGNLPGIEINDEDKTGFMSVIDNLDPSNGLDLILHTPGGDTAATESIVTYLKSVFNNDIRVIVPEIAMSGGTMIACSSKEILLGKASSLGPIDPQFSGLPAHGIIEEFKRAAEEIRKDPSLIYVWQPIIAKYNPTLIGECEKSIKWAEEMVREWLTQGMFKDDATSNTKIDKILKELGDHALTKSHARHISLAKAKEIGLKVANIDENSELSKAILSVHNAVIHTLTSTLAFKIIENHLGTAFIKIQTPIVGSTQ